jgi:transposase
MAKAYGDNLGVRILQVYQQGEGTEAELARHFGVSLGYVEKIRGQQLRTGQMERVPHKPGPESKFTEPVRERLRDWLRHQPNLTLAESQDKLLDQV